MTVPNPHPAQSPEWWRQRLLGRLLTRNRESLTWWDYYYVRYPTPDVSDQTAAAYRLMLQESRHAWAKLITGAIAERLNLEGVTVGDETLSLLLWRTFKRNHMDADQRAVYLDALVTGYGYVSVYPDDDGAARVRSESSTEVIHEPDPADTRRTLAALKLFFDDVAGHWNAMVMLPDSVYQWETPGTRAAAGGYDPNINWGQADTGWATVDEFPNGLGEVSYVPFSNEPDMLRHGHSEIEPVEAMLRRIDRLSLNLLLAAETAAFRQKWATGLKIPKDPATGKPIQPFNVALDKLWTSTGTDTKFGSFDATSLDGYIKALSEAVAQLAAISRVPAHYLLSQSLANPPSAESLDASEMGLIAKVEDRQGWWGESWEQVFRLIVKADSTFTADEELLLDTDVLWQDPTRKSEAQLADAALKWASVGIPTEVIWERLGASPSEIARWRNTKLMEDMQKALTQPVAVPAGAPQGDDADDAESDDERPDEPAGT